MQLNVTANTLTGNSNTDMGKFHISENTPIVVSGNSYNAYKLSYEHSKQPIDILIVRKSGKVSYIVRSKNLEIRYKGFRIIFFLTHDPG